MKILVVDDEKTLVKGIKFNLENEGYQVECAYDGAAAVELARNNKFDLLILDVMMPEVDGLEACMRIREFSNVPIIMLTAKSDDTDKLMGFECGADDYLTKPFNILELKARVRALLRRAPILLLDEATSALDPQTEEQMMKNLMSSGMVRTCILVTHRPGTQKFCNRSYFIRDGIVREEV